MKYAIDETELARLEYLIEASESCGYSTKSDDPNMQYLAAACHYTPALVAEVRRLREALNTFIEEDQSRVILVQQQMLDCLREKVEALEWFEECFDNCKQRGKLPLELHKTPSAYSEAWASLWAAREAVHADRE